MIIILMERDISNYDIYISVRECISSKPRGRVLKERISEAGGENDSVEQCVDACGRIVRRDSIMQIVL